MVGELVSCMPQNFYESNRRFELLKLKPTCECCDTDLPTDSTEARMCSFECTFCSRCAEEKFDDMCPNCGGQLVVSPTCPDDYLKEYPLQQNAISMKNMLTATLILVCRRIEE